jgi:hypothetical protein
MPLSKSIWSLYFQRLKLYVSGLITFHDLEVSPLSQDHVIMLGSIFSCMWKYYWQCVIDERSWQTSEVQSLFLADHVNIIMKYRACVAFTDLSSLEFFYLAPLFVFFYLINKVFTSIQKKK